MKRLFVVVFLGLVGSQVRGDILLRSGFEDHEWQGWQVEWVRDPDGAAHVRRREECGDEFQTQAHGGFSIYVNDPDDQSYANASHEFPDLGMRPPEYMVEFYFYLAKAAAGDVDDLLLYHPTRYDPYEGTEPADITVELVAVTDIEYVSEGDYWMGTWVLHIEDDEGTHEVFLDSVRLDSWHKFQMHRHGPMDLWVDGDSIGSYDARIGGWAPDTFLIGTDDEDNDGQAFWDDFIVTTVPDGEHPRVAFESVKGLLMEALSQDWNTGQGRRSVSPQYFTPGNVEALIGLSLVYDKEFDGLSNYERMTVQNALITRTRQLKLAVKYQDLPVHQDRLLEKAIILASDVLGDSETLSYLTEK